MKLYLIGDVLQLADIFQLFRKKFTFEYKLDPAHFLTLPAYSLQCALYQTKAEIDLISNLDNILILEKNIRGGFTSVVQKNCTFNVKGYEEYDESQPESFGTFLDINSLYASVLAENLPVDKMEEVSDFSFDDAKNDQEHGYMLMIDYKISEESKLKTDQLPLSLKSRVVTWDDLSPETKNLCDLVGMKFTSQKTLTASHESEEDYLIALPLLCTLMELGLEVIKIKKVFKFRQTKVFESYIKRNIELRSKSTSPFEKSLFKLMNNALFGKMLFNPRKHQLKTRLISSTKLFRKWAGSPLLKDCNAISEDQVLMTLHAESIDFNFPLQIGFWVLDCSKQIFYDIFYNLPSESKFLIFYVSHVNTLF